MSFMKEDIIFVNFWGVLSSSLSITFTSWLYVILIAIQDTYILANLSARFDASFTGNDEPWTRFSGHTDPKNSFNLAQCALINYQDILGIDISNIYHHTSLIG